MQEQGLRFLIPYMQPYRKMLLLGTLYAFIGAAASAFSPTLLGWGVDSLTDGVQLRVLGLFALGLVALSATLALFRYLLRMLTGRIAAGVTYSMSAELFHRLLLFDKETREKYGTGDLLSRATSDFIYIWRFYSAGFQMSMHSLFLLIIGCILMSFTSPALAITVVVMLVSSILVQIRLGRILERSFSGVQEKMAHISAFVEDHLGAAQMLTAYAQEKAVGQAFKQANDEYVNQNLGFILRSALISRIPRFVVQLASTVIVLVGGMMIIGDQLTVGQYVQFIFYLTLLNSAAMQLTGAFERLQQGSAAAGRIGEILHKWPRIRNRENAQSQELQGQLSFENVGVWAADQERWILRDVNLEIEAGTTVGIVGPTGAGKSMLIGLLGRIHDPDEGAVRVDGHDLRDLKLAALRQDIAYVPQQNLLFSMTLRNNIALGVPETPEPRIWRAIDQSRLSNDLEQLPKGLESIVGERGATLSGGQRQRTAIARALVRRPKVLLLDDALASVDMKTSSEIIRALREERDRRTCIIVSQRMAAVQDADKIIVLNHGNVVEQGTHAELLAMDGLYAEIYNREIEQSDVDHSDTAQGEIAHAQLANGQSKKQDEVAK